MRSFIWSLVLDYILVNAYKDYAAPATWLIGQFAENARHKANSFRRFTLGLIHIGSSQELEKVSDATAGEAHGARDDVP